jgi:hypothetical protein
MTAYDSPDTPYFRIERRPARHVGSAWRAVASIVRKDTDELVDQFSAKDASREAAEERLAAAVATRLAALQRPDDWGKDATIPHLLQRYLRMRDELYGMVLNAQASAEPEAARLRREAESFEQAELRALSDQVAALTEQQRLELAGVTEDQRTRRNDARVLDILTAKKRLSALIPNPSPSIEAAYRDLVRALNE